MNLLVNVKPDYYLNSYVDDFVSKFNSCFLNVQLDSLIGDQEYALSLEGSKWLYRFFEMKDSVCEIRGSHMYAQDKVLLDAEKNIVFVVAIVYDMIKKSVKFFSHSYGRLNSQGFFVPSKSLSTLIDDYRHESMFNMVNTLD
jgi:hypothetical protein